MKPTTRRQAKELGVGSYFTGKPCKYGHVAHRYTGSGACSACQIPQVKEYHAQDPERQKGWRKTYRVNHPEAHNLNARIQQAKVRNKENLVHLTSIEQMMVKNYYEDAANLTKETGVEHEVDHIIPRSLGGPHAPWNLQVLTKSHNASKGNR